MTEAVIILGMHRSGTSALSGVIGLLGVGLGDNLHAAQAGVNEKGFWEHAEITEIHDSILRAIGSYWDDFLPLRDQWIVEPNVKRYLGRLQRVISTDFGRRALWGVKDPRLCRLLPVWLPLLEEQSVKPRFILAIRDPAEVCESLRTRDGISADKGLLLWLTYNLEAELWSRGCPRTVVTFDGLVEKPEPTLEAVEGMLDNGFPRRIEDTLPEIRKFLSPALRHHRGGGLRADTDLQRLASKTYGLLAAGQGRGQTLAVRFDECRADLESITGGFPPVLIEQLRVVANQRGRYEQMFLEAYNSVSWKLNWPVRVIERALRSGSPSSL